MREKARYTKIKVKCQAAAELAIFGALILTVLGVILSYGQRFDFQQHVKMEAFRKALREAYYRNATISYTYRKDSRSADAFGGFGLGQPSTAQASASIMWAKGVAGIQEDDNQDEHRSFTIQNINDTIIDFPKYPKEITDRTGEDRTVYVPVGLYELEVLRRSKYKAKSERQEDSDKIVSGERAELQEELKSALHTRFDVAKTDERDNPIDQYPDYRYEGGAYEFEGDWFTFGVEGGYGIDQVAEIRDNRIYFRERAPGEATPVIERERTWTTSH